MRFFILIFFAILILTGCDKSKIEPVGNEIPCRIDTIYREDYSVQSIYEYHTNGYIKSVKVYTTSEVLDEYSEIEYSSNQIKSLFFSGGYVDTIFWHLNTKGLVEKSTSVRNSMNHRIIDTGFYYYNDNGYLIKTEGYSMVYPQNGSLAYSWFEKDTSFFSGENLVKTISVSSHHDLKDSTITEYIFSDTIAHESYFLLNSPSYFPFFGKTNKHLIKSIIGHLYEISPNETTYSYFKEDYSFELDSEGKTKKVISTLTHESDTFLSTRFIRYSCD